VIIFLTLPAGTRYAMVGDLVWQLEGITLREERPWISRKGSDSDAEGTRQNLLRMIALKECAAPVVRHGRCIEPTSSLPTPSGCNGGLRS